MRRLVIAALGVVAALAALAQCGGTSGNDATPSPAIGATIDATVEGAAPSEPQDASSDQSVYTNRFDVDIQYADQMLPEVQAPSQGGGGGNEAGLGVPDCPPFISVDPKGNPCDPATCNLADSIPADWSDGGEVPAREGGVCATYPWLGSLATDECVTSNLDTVSSATNTYNPLPPCNWARDAGLATQGPKIGIPRYDLCVELYNCFMRTRCFIYPNPNPASQGSLGTNPIPCFCLKPSDLNGTFSAPTCESEKGPCYDEETAALEAPIDPSNPASTATYVQMNWTSLQNGNGEVGFEGALLNQMFESALTCVPRCALDAGLGCDQ